ncbi:hypothetical protein UlMin_039397 [Ulmus minor]
MTTPQAPATPGYTNNEQTSTLQTQKNEKISDYEQSREERIKQNFEKMQKLGIFDLSLKIKSNIHQNRPKKNRPSNKTPPTPLILRPSGPSRRSSRLQNVTPVSYMEEPAGKKEKRWEAGDLLPEVGSKPEIYTEEHEKLLGYTEKSWTLFVDGYGNDGKRIYDQVRGKTCHQCRQKTLGHRTHCSECNKVQGQFCGDCLYMRYGEHVLEAKEDPNWKCPVCRGICNCSLCRQAKGWAPTGTLYKKISALGFKSVAHYLIQTCRAEAKQEESPETPNQVCVKSESSEQFEDKSDSELKDKNESQNYVKRSLPFPDEGPAENIGSPNYLYENKGDDYFQSDKEKSSHGIECGNSGIVLKMEFSEDTEPNTDSAYRVDDDDLPKAEKKVLDGKQAVENKILLGKEVDQSHDDELQQLNGENADVEPAIEDVSSGKEMEKQIEVLPSYSSTPLERRTKRKHVVEPSQDSIGGRLRLRRRTSLGPSEENSDTAQAANGLTESNSSLPISDSSIARRLRSRDKAT